VPDDEGHESGDRELIGHWYANCFEVGHNAFEFKVDCGQNSADGGIVTVYFRVIASPFSARELFRQLGVALLRYSDTFGPIDGKDAGGRAGSGP
jgi:hypothetical protein